MNPEQRAMYISYLMSQGKTKEQAEAMAGPAPTNVAGTSQVGSANMFSNSFNFMTGTSTQDQGSKNINDFQTKEEYLAYIRSVGKDPVLASRNWDDLEIGDERPISKVGEDTPQAGNSGMQGFPLLYPGGSDISTELFTLGRGLGAAKGSKGKGAAIVGGAGAAVFDATRNILSGVGYEKSNQYVEDWYRKQQYGPDSNRYTRNSQYKNANVMAEMDFQDGGEFFKPVNIDIIGGISNKEKKYFEDGGEREEEERGEFLQSSQEEKQEEGEGQLSDQQQQVQQMIAQAIQQGQEPQLIIQALVQKGMDEQQATQLVSQVVQMMQQQNQEESEEESEMKKGGKFKHRVGDYVEFMFEGKLKKGKIKRIENGKIFL